MKSAFDIELVPEHDVVIDIRNLHHEMTSISAYIYRYFLHKGQIESELEESEAVLKRERAKKYNLLKNGTSKITEKQIENQLLTDQELEPIHNQINKLKADLREVDAIVKALKVKESMVIQLGADARKEN